MELQKTIKREVTVRGVGLNTGSDIEARLLPAPRNSGVNFIRRDLPERPTIAANPENVENLEKSPRHTTLANGNNRIQTIEHLMAALSGLGVDNLTIELNGEELPALDGSSAGYVKVLNEAGTEDQDAPKRYFQLKEPIWCQDQDALLMALPARELAVSYTLHYNHPLIQCQYISTVINKDTFEKEIAPSRTFCLAEEVERLIQEGLGKGANYENTLVVGKDGVIKNKLRFPDEYARHKILDLIGDMNLLGYPLKAQFIGIRSGHSLNVKLLEKIRLQKEKIMEGGVMAQKDVVITGKELDTSQIQKILPHRYPFLLVDRILEFVPRKRAVGIKNVTANENFFVGHFPGHPVMPGVLIIEAMAQVAGVLMLSDAANKGKIAYFMGIDNVKFRKTVTPGDQLFIEVEILKFKTKIGQVRATAKVDGKLVAEGELLFSVAEV